MNSIQEARRRRYRTGPSEDEDASKLQFGPDFVFAEEGQESDLYALNLSETRLLIAAALKQRRIQDPANADTSDAAYAAAGGASPSNGEEEEDEDFAGSNEVLRKTQEYLATFARFRDPQTVNAVEHLLKSMENSNLHPFEVAQLGTLVCDDSEEAKTLIPSLGYKKSDEELQVLLDHLRRFG